MQRDKKTKNATRQKDSKKKRQKDNKKKRQCLMGGRDKSLLL